MTENCSERALGVGFCRDCGDDVLRLFPPHDVVNIPLLQFRVHIQEIGFVLRFQHHLVHTSEFTANNAHLSKLLQ